MPKKPLRLPRGPKTQYLVDLIAAMDVEFTAAKLTPKIGPSVSVSRELVRKVLQALRRSGYVRSRGRGRAARWRRIRRIPDALRLTPDCYVIEQGPEQRDSERAIRALAELRAAAKSYTDWSDGDRVAADTAWLITLYHLPHRWLHPAEWTPADQRLPG
mgnify:CR=1 FL=1